MNRYTLNALIIFVGLPLFSTTVLALYFTAKRLNHPSRRLLGVTTLLLGVPAFLVFFYFTLIVLILWASGGARWAVPPGLIF